MATQRTSSPNPFAALYSDNDDEDDLSPAGPEVAAVGAGTMANNVFNTTELRPMKYKQAMKTKDTNEWKEAVKDELKRFTKNEVYKVVPIEDVPDGTHVMTTTWACKKKANGVFRASLNVRG